MGKMILITTDNEVKELEYPDAGLKSWKKLKEHIGNRCELIEHVQPKRLYTEIGAGIEVKNVPGSKVSMLVDEEFYFHCDETKLNKIASWLYETLERSMEMQELSFVKCQKNSSILSFLN